MPHLDRDSFIALLDRLGDPDEAEVLATAREIDRRVRESGMTWSELLAPPPSAARGSGESYDEYRGAFTDDDLFDVDQPRPREGYASDTALIDELLANQDLAPETRQELLDFKSDIAEGEFTDMDAKYLRGLHARLTRQTHSTA
ncbi:MAG TPA: hypothetical protein VEX87_14095 [Skermanella sp.]|jgi:hypothetical protein|nr:hypothetical protein [Skermanella sp.]